MSNKSNRLFSEFDPATKEDWIEKATVDLKGADFSKRLVWKNLNGIDVQPFYSRQDEQSPLINSGKSDTAFVNYRRILLDSENKNALAQLAISEGMNGVLFELDGSESVEKLLEGIDLNTCAIAFSLSKANDGFAQTLLSYLKNSETEAEAIKGYLSIDFFEKYLSQGTLEEKDLDYLAKWTKDFAEFSNFKTLVINGSTYIDSGSNQVQEIAFTLNSMTFLLEELRKKGVNEQKALNSIQFILGIGSEYFIEIAKLRAFSSLFYQVSEKYGLKNPGAVLMSKTSIWSKSVTDANTNMLRATTEAMSAILGNSQAIEIDPYDSEMGSSKDFSRRIAGNIATILKEESYFGKVSNPVDGSYYIEELTLELAQKALELFKEIESLGGFYKGIEQQTIQNKIALVRMTKIKLLSQRRMAMVGVNKYPNLMENISAEVLCHEIDKEDPKLLTPRRAGLELEMIRANTEAIVNEKGARPIVEFASFGNLTMRKARAGFAFDFLGIGGYSIEDEKSYDSVEKAAETSATSKSDIVVICSSDEDYQTSALELVEKFRSINDSKILLLAGNPTELMDELQAAGLDACINVRSDIFNTLNDINNKLNRTTKTLEI